MIRTGTRFYTDDDYLMGRRELRRVLKVRKALRQMRRDHEAREQSRRDFVEGLAAYEAKYGPLVRMKDREE